MQDNTNTTTQTAAAADNNAAAATSTAATTILTGADNPDNAAAAAAATTATDGAATQTQTADTILTGAAAKAGEAGQQAANNGGTQDPKAGQEPGQQAADQPLTGIEGMEYAKGELDELSALAKKHNLPNEAATEILQWQAKFAKEAAAKMDEQISNEIKQTVHDEAVKNAALVHKEWGTDPKVVAANEAAVALAMRHFADDDFKALMNSTGLGSHPAVVRVMLKVLVAYAPTLGNNYVGFTQTAVDSVLSGFGSAFVGIALVFFVFTTVMAYYFYVESSIVYLFSSGSNPNKKAEKICIWVYRILLLGIVVFGALKEAGVVWMLGDVGVGLTAWVNVLALLVLCPQAVALLKEYEKSEKK